MGEMEKMGHYFDHCAINGPTLCLIITKVKYVRRVEEWQKDCHKSRCGKGIP